MFCTTDRFSEEKLSTNHIMNIKTLFIALAAGTIAFASCEKPEPAPVPAPDPVLAEVTTAIDGQSVKISGTVKDFTFENAETTPVGVWSSLDNGSKKTEVKGSYNAEKKTIEGTIANLEYEKAYTVGTFVSVKGKKFYSKGAAVTIKEPVTPVKFSAVAATAENNSLKVSGKTEDFKFIDNDKTSVGIWYSTDAGKTKTEVKGSFNAETSTIEGTATELAYTTYTAGVWAVEDGQKQFSEGVEVTLTAPVTPVKFSEVTATAEGQNVTVSGKTADFTYVDAEKTAVGIWYTAQGQAEKTKIAGAYDAETSTVSATAENLAYGTYTFGIYANEDGTEQFSEGVEVTLAAPATPVVFSGISKKVEGQNVTVSGITADFTYVDDTKTAVGAWYTAEGQTGKTKVAGTFDPETSTITAIIENLPYGTYTVGIYANEDGTEQYSEGIEAHLVEPASFSEVTAKAEGNVLSASGKVAGFTFVDMETTAVGLWYTNAEDKRKEAKGTYDTVNNIVTATSKALPSGDYTVGIFVRKDGIKFYSEGVAVTIATNPGFHIPDFGNGTEF